MNFGLVGFLSMSWVGLTAYNRFLEGAVITLIDVGHLNDLRIMTKVQVGIFSIPVPNLNFMEGIIRLVKWDYSFFGGDAQIFTFFMYAVSFALGFMLFMMIIGLLYNYFGKR